MNQEVDASYRYSERVARQAASNFYWSFYVLPRAERRAMCALYAFSRVTDDLGDNAKPAAERHQELEAWKAAAERALRGGRSDGLWPALKDMVDRYAIPHEYLLAIVDGVAMDLVPPHYETFDELCDYCDHVASAVGLACIHIWGFHDERAKTLAVSCGRAFQMTNILRDLREDATQQRIYLPREELARFAYSASDLEQGVVDERFRALLHFQIRRTERLYQEAAPLASYLHPSGRRAFLVMFATYRALLNEIHRCDGDVLSGPVRLSGYRKLTAALSTLCSFARSGSPWHEGPAHSEAEAATRISLSTAHPSVPPPRRPVVKTEARWK